MKLVLILGVQGNICKSMSNSAICDFNVINNSAKILSQVTNNQSTMLDLAELPKNANGFRTTHTCELCGFEPKTKNKYREKQDHLVMKHFKDRIDKIFPHCRPYSCPNKECEFTGKDKQALLRHYTGKHGVLEVYLRDALREKGITYHLSDSAKRKSMGNNGNDCQRRAKEARLSPELSHTILPDTCHQELTRQPSPMVNEPLLQLADTTTADFSEGYHHHQTIKVEMSPIQARLLPSEPTQKLPSMSTVFNGPARHQPTKSEVEAMLSSFQPLNFQPNHTTNTSNTSNLPIDSWEVTSTTRDPLGLDSSASKLIDLFLPNPSECESSKLITNDDIMWGGGNPSLHSTEPAQTVPFLDGGDSSGYVNLDDVVGFTYLYPATVDTGPVGSQGERQLTFSHF